MDDTIILEMNAIRKAFGTVVALNDVDLQLHRKEIHGLLGGNGAGKTTLVNVLFGLYKPDSGTIRIHGEETQIQSPRDAINHKIGMVHQHFLQIDSYTVTENIVLGTPLRNWPALNLDAQTQRIRELSEQFGLQVDPDAFIGDLPIGVRQKAEILKALYRGVEVLILDEPTTCLTPQEVDALFQSLRVMVNEGMSIVFITHKMREVLGVCDRITVLRNGKNVFSNLRQNVTEKSLVNAMVGEGLDVDKSIVFSSDLSRPGAEVPIVKPTMGEPVLIVENLSASNEDGVPVATDYNFEVRAGEIMGIAGVTGNGQQELAECLMSIRPIDQGSVRIHGIDSDRSNTKSLLESGVAYIPQDRLQDGFLPKASVAHNMILGYQNKSAYSNKGFLDWRSIYERARNLISEYNIMTPSEKDVAAKLSGGNIQRVLLARAFSHSTILLIAHNPTQGLDIRSMDFVYNKMLELRDEGTAILLISEDLDELFRMCDRIGTIYKGKMVGILDRTQFDKYEIGLMMSGANLND